MKNNINHLKLTVGKLDQQRVRVGLTVLTLVLFVLGAGAPGAGGH